MAGKSTRAGGVSAYYAGVGLSIHALKSQPKSYKKRQKITRTDAGKLLHRLSMGTTISAEIELSDYM